MQLYNKLDNKNKKQVPILLESYLDNDGDDNGNFTGLDFVMSLFSSPPRAINKQIDYIIFHLIQLLTKILTLMSKYLTSEIQNHHFIDNRMCATETRVQILANRSHCMIIYIASVININ